MDRIKLGRRGLAAGRMLAGICVTLIIVIVWTYNYESMHTIFPEMAKSGGADPELIDHVVEKNHVALKGLVVACLLIIFSAARTDDHPSNIRRY